MRAAGVVERDLTPNAGLRFGYAVIGVQLHLLVLDAAPEPLDEHIVAPASPLPSMLCTILWAANSATKPLSVN